jgi:hypothetical protein
MLSTDRPFDERKAKLTRMALERARFIWTLLKKWWGYIWIRDPACTPTCGGWLTRGSCYCRLAIAVAYVVALTAKRGSSKVKMDNSPIREGAHAMADLWSQVSEPLSRCCSQCDVRLSSPRRRRWRTPSSDMMYITGVAVAALWRCVGARGQRRVRGGNGLHDVTAAVHVDRQRRAAASAQEGLYWTLTTAIHVRNSRCATEASLPCLNATLPLGCGACYCHAVSAVGHVNDDDDDDVCRNFVPVEDGFGTTAGNAERGAKYGNVIVPPRAVVAEPPPVFAAAAAAASPGGARWPEPAAAVPATASVPPPYPTAPAAVPTYSAAPSAPLSSSSEASSVDSKPRRSPTSLDMGAQVTVNQGPPSAARVAVHA